MLLHRSRSRVLKEGEGFLVTANTARRFWGAFVIINFIQHGKPIAYWVRAIAIKQKFTLGVQLNHMIYRLSACSILFELSVCCPVYIYQSIYKRYGPISVIA